MLDTLLSTPFLPHRACLIMRPDLIALHVISDALIAFAYFAIPLILVHFVRRRPLAEWMFSRVLLLFAAFIMLCGVTHVFGIITMWVPVYYLEGAVKLLTALVSLATAAALVPIVPRVLAMRSPEELAQINAQLQDEIRAREAADRELQKTIDDLSRSNRELEQFAYVASHDLKAPLRTIASFAQLLERRHADKLAGEGLEFTGFIRQSAAQMQAVIDDLLQLARLHSDTVAATDVSLSRLFDQAQRQLDAVIQESAAEIDCPADLPTVRGDHAQLLLLAQNLLTNAIKFQPPGQPPRVQVRAQREGEHWHLRVRDNGIGIEAGQEEVIFDLFRRLHAQEAYPGTGVGLALCRRVVERHDGRIWAAANEDGAPGTTIHVLLPALGEASRA